MVFELRAIGGTANHLIVQRPTPSAPVMLVAEVVEMPEGYTIYRMDVTGVLGDQLPTPEAALEYFERWVTETGPTLEGVGL